MPTAAKYVHVPFHDFVLAESSLSKLCLSSVGLLGLVAMPAAELLLLGRSDAVGLLTLPEEPGRCPLLLLDRGT